MIPTVYMSVPVKRVEGLARTEKRHVRVLSVDWVHCTMRVSYEADLQGVGVSQEWEVLVQYNPFIRKYFKSAIK